MVLHAICDASSMLNQSGGKQLHDVVVPGRSSSLTIAITAIEQ
jgi:hypothetical protein